MAEMVRDPRELMAQGGDGTEAGSKDLQTAREASVQQRATTGRGRPGLSLFMMGAAGDAGLLPGWWSRRRDAELRRFWRKVDHLSGAVYTMESLISTIPFRVEPLDTSIASHKRQAEQMTRMLLEESDFGGQGNGWGTWVSKWVEDHVTQDNGAFTEVLGDGPADGPIRGPVLGLAHLDSWRCTRTGDPEYPVVYADTNGQQFKLHWTRVMAASSMPSPASEMNGVGFCAVSRCVNVAQTLLDMLVYRQEKLGSRPAQGILVTKGGLDPDDVSEAFEVAEEAMNSQMLRRYSKFVVVGDRGIRDAGLELVELTGLPEGFEEKDATGLAMAAIALAFGTDPRELFPGMTIGATRAEALIAHLKQRGKGPGQLLETLERMFNAKVLPPHLRMVFDFQDDAQDQQRAEIQLARSTRRTEELGSQVLDVRAARELALEDGDLTEAQFADLELRDGRLANGDDLLSLFYRKDYAEWLDLGVVDPVNAPPAERQAVAEAARTRRAELFEALERAGDGSKRTPIVESLAALERLEKRTAKREPASPPPPPPGAAGPAVGEPGGQADGQERPLGADDLSLKALAVRAVDPADELLAEAIGLMRQAADETKQAGNGRAVWHVGPGEVPDLRPVVVEGADMLPVAEAIREQTKTLAGLRPTVHVRNDLGGLALAQQEQVEATKQQSRSLERLADVLTKQTPPTVVFDAGPLAEAVRGLVEGIGQALGGLAGAVREQKPPVVNLPETPVRVDVQMTMPTTRKRIERDAQGRPAAIVEEAAE